MKSADPLGGLLPPAPPARDLPDRDRHRREVLAAIEAGRWPARLVRPVRPARFRPRTVAWLAPLGAALAVLVILTGVFVLPGLFSGAQPGGSRPTAPGHPAAGGRHPGPWHRRTESYLVSSPVVRTVVIHGGVGSVSVTGAARSTVSVGAHLAYRGRVPVMSHKILRDVLELFYICRTGSTCRVSFNLAIPRGLNVVAHYAVGQIRLTGLTGAVTAFTDTGQIHATALSARFAQLTTDTGAISAGFTVPPQWITANTGVGSVAILVPATGRYKVTASAQIGPVTVDVPRSVRPRHVIQVNTGTGAITVSDK